jgi:hypothetical protein
MITLAIVLWERAGRRPEGRRGGTEAEGSD